LIPVETVDDRFDDEFADRLWREAHPRQALPSKFASHLRTCARAYVEMASRPSQGELGQALKQLHDRLIRAVEANDPERAARALEELPHHIRAELSCLPPAGIPSPDDIRNVRSGIGTARDLLGMCASGADIVPGRRRPSGRRSRPTLRILPRYQQRRGHPRHEAERLLVRSLLEFFYNRDGKFPGLTSHGGNYAQSAGPFAHLVVSTLARCGVKSVNAVKLIQRCLAELPKPDPLSPNKGQ
jgi:hypothetical protein